MPSDAEQADLDYAHVDAALNVLIEHFDTVQIFATRHMGDEGTAQVARGRGNWFARKGQVEEWLDVSKEEVLMPVRKRGED